MRAFFTRNPPLYAAIAGLLAPKALAPGGAVDLSQALLVAILPIGFFAVGATLAENAEHGELPMPPPMTRPVALALGTRLAVVPALLMLLAAPLIDLPAAYRLLSAMPSGINSMVVAHAYGLDMEITAEAVTWSTAIVVVASLPSRCSSERAPILGRCSSTSGSRSRRPTSSARSSSGSCSASSGSSRPRPWPSSPGWNERGPRST